MPVAIWDVDNVEAGGAPGTVVVMIIGAAGSAE